MKHPFEPTEKWIANFWSKVNKGPHPKGCWLWTACQSGRGYGVIGWPGRRDRMMLAHRASFFLAGKEVTDDKPCVIHSCHNRDCVNPAHLSAGSKKDNSEDMVAAGRSCKGDRHYSHTQPEKVPRGDNHFSRTHPEKSARGSQFKKAKLTEEKVVMIRERCANGELQREVAASMGVTTQAVSLVVNRQLWKHVP